MVRVKRILIIIGFLCLVFSFSFVGMADELPEFEFPVLITSSGQCPQYDIIDVFAQQAGLKYDKHRMPTLDMVQAGVGLGEAGGATIGTDLEEYPEGTPYKTVIFSMGASMKGMGAAGISSEEEYKRVEAIVSWLREQEDVKIIGVHVAGEDRRYHHLSEGMIDRVGPYSDLLLIAHESDEDDRFTKMSDENNIPLKLIETEFEIATFLSEFFDLE